MLRTKPKDYSTTVPLRYRDVQDHADDYEENVCQFCGGENRESIGGNAIPTRCSRCQLVYPGFMVNRCLKLRK